MYVHVHDRGICNEEEACRIKHVCGQCLIRIGVMDRPLQNAKKRQVNGDFVVVDTH